MTQEPDNNSVLMIGHVAALLMTVLHQRGVIAPRILADQFGLYANIVHAHDPVCGDGLIRIAAMVLDAAFELEADG